MAKGDVIWFNQFSVDILKKLHDISSDVLKAGIITAAATPAKTTADPRWGAGGTTNFATNEITPGGNYSAGGVTLAGVTVTLASGGKIDFTDINIPVHAANATDGRWLIIYNDTDAGKRCLCAIDFGAAIDMTANPLDVVLPASGLTVLAQP